MFCKKGVLRNFVKFTGKHLRQSLFFNKVAGLKSKALAQVFSCEFYEISQNTFLTEHLWWLLLLFKEYQDFFQRYFYNFVPVCHFSIHSFANVEDVPITILAVLGFLIS